MLEDPDSNCVRWFELLVGIYLNCDVEVWDGSWLAVKKFEVYKPW